MSQEAAPGPSAVSYEERPWDADGTAMSRRARLQARGRYKAALVPPIADAVFDLPASVAAEAGDALNEITRFDAELSSRQGTYGVEFAPLAAVLLRTESASSSQIENVTAGAKALALAVIHEGAGENARLVAANVEAMRRAIDLTERLGHAEVQAIQGVLTAGQEQAQPGRYREGQVWIGGHAPTPHTASFVPPHDSRVVDAMEDLFVFGERTDLPVLVHAALAHAHFETIHPFADGNGRTGRALVHVMLRRAGATTRLTIPVSAGLLVEVDSYFAALTAYRHGDAVPIVEQFTSAAFAAVDKGRRLDLDLADIYAEWEEVVHARRHATVWRVLPHLVAQPAVNVAFVREATGVSDTAAAAAIDRLVEAGVLSPASANRRNRVWVADRVLGALDEFAARAGRRGAPR
ncbi:Fic family protein [Nocardioides sp. W7]|uniref:Fic family protein n=1 Tax=Nocardioides sp. W7 TaxID=2931390 RepID=UPI001FD3238A|nr:Fic family protein [Nocardioides sp. W7]